MDAELASQASWSLQEPAATAPLLSVHASVLVQRGAGSAFTIPADPTITRIPQRAAATGHIRLIMLDPPALCLALRKHTCQIFSKRGQCYSGRGLEGS
jgi:hypothetical protein